MDRLERSGPQPEGKFDRQQQQIFDLPPWVYVKNLASKSLSLAARRIRSDWQKRYAYSPVLLETFVDPHKIQRYLLPGSQLAVFGPDRRAWPHGPLQKRLLVPKHIYAYPPLVGDFRARLKGEKS